MSAAEIVRSPSMRTSWGETNSARPKITSAPRLSYRSAESWTSISLITLATRAFTAVMSTGGRSIAGSPNLAVSRTD